MYDNFYIQRKITVPMSGIAFTSLFFSHLFILILTKGS